MSDSNAGSGARVNYAQYIGIGFTFILVLGLFAGGGYLLDQVLGTLPLFLLVGLGLGFAGVLYYAYITLKKMDGR